MKNLLMTLFVLLLAGMTTEVAAQSYKVIVNPENAVESISKGNLNDIFMKEKTKWDDGSDILPMNLTAQSRVRADFTIQIHEQSVAAIRSHWQQAAFSGAGNAPLERSNDAAVIQFVASNPGAIGYISIATDASGVKVVTVE